jgi:hypothetical protein
MNGLILGNWGPAIAEGKGLQLQEIEGQFTAAVDPYFFANFILSIEGPSGSMSPEEAWVSTLGLPVVSLKVGKFFQNFGKNNLIHTHAQPLIDRPLVNQLILGEEAFNTSGVQADILVPLPWYVNLSVAGVTAKTAELYQGNRDEDLANVTRIENLLFGRKQPSQPVVPLFRSRSHFEICFPQGTWKFCRHLDQRIHSGMAKGLHEPNRTHLG